MTLYAGFISLAAGLSVGLSGLAAGFAVGVVGDAGVRGSAQQPRLFVGTHLSLFICFFCRMEDLMMINLNLSACRNDFNFDFCRSLGMCRLTRPFILCKRYLLLISTRCFHPIFRVFMDLSVCLTNLFPLG